MRDIGAIVASGDTTMVKFARILLATVAGYAGGVVAGMVLVWLLTSNSHDKSAEMVMTSVFFTGPVGAVIGLVFGLWKRKAVDC